MTRRWLGILVYLVVVAAFLEGCSRLALSKRWFFSRIAGPEETSQRLRWVRRYQFSGAVQYHFDAWSPTLGWKLEPGIRAMAVFEGKTLNSNSRGARGLREYAPVPPPQVRRVVALGDSFTFGEAVSDDETFCHQIEQLDPGVEVINLGVHGYGHDQMLLRFEEDGRSFRPHVVLLGFVAEDMDRNAMAFRDYAKPRFRRDGARLVLTNTPIPSPEQMMAREPWRSKLIDLLVMLRDRWRRSPQAVERDAESLTVAILERLAASVRAVDVQPLFVFLPTHHDMTAPKATEKERFLLSFCRERSIAAFSVRPSFIAAERRGVRLTLRGHYGPVEHRIVAEAIAPALRKLPPR